MEPDGFSSQCHGRVWPGSAEFEQDGDAKVLVSFQSGRNHKGNVNKAPSLQGSLRCDERLAVEKEEELWGLRHSVLARMTFPSQTQASVEKCCSYSCEEGDPDLWEQTDSGLPEPVLVCGPLASESNHTECSRGQAVCSRGQGVQSP